ncbi:hybrid sensor histidine kinase/response regulator [Thiohalomonas denitrificans]|uniref:Chemotaxis protein CheA n=1 Tax=Thiohalomonas denitrificans TaxID=415747 RepID=A0A1G5QJF0_9GAMM|nr:Hpt domain-containing protein [Thiohalomonas denitrificans]SCZ61832.1 chemosensory pili system protein ChpA (sensor histidine kinase/response regulator) [Thiohalomonas denitrificans]
MQTAETFDVSTLAWIKGELDETLNDARQALESFADAPEDAGELDACVDALHQVQRTLQMVELSAAAQFLAEVETFARALQHGELVSADSESGGAEEALMRAILELPDYLDGLQSGRPNTLLPLLPLVNEMRRLRGEAEWSELSVFHPDLSIRPPSRESAGNLQAVARKARPHYQTALANLLRDRETATSLQTLRKVLGALFKIADEIPVRQALWAGSALVEALSEKGLEISSEVKHLLGKLEQLVKYLSQKGETGANAGQVQALTRVLLYHVGHATAGGAMVAGIKDAFGLDRFFPEEGLSAGLTAELKKTVAADIMEELSQVKDILDVFVRGQRTDLDSLQPIGDGLLRLADTLVLLRQEDLQQALRDQVEVLGRIRLGELAPDDEVLMGVAGALLLVESTLQDWGSSTPVEKADDNGGYAGQFPEAEHLRGVRQVMKESLGDLIRVRELLAGYLDNPGDTGRLSSLPADFHRLVGSLNLLSYSRVARILQASAAYVRDEILNGKTIPDTSQLDQLADAVMSVEYYLEAFVQSRVHPASVLDVAENALAALGYPTGEFLERMNAGARDLSIAGEEAEVDELPQEPGAAVVAEPLDETGSRGPDAEGHGEEDDIDEEITAVFLEEAQEELEKITRLLPVWEANPSDHDVLAEYRRSFHTLKGSGRLVGAEELGEFAWSFEKMLNQVIDRAIEPGPVLFDLLHRAERVIPHLVEQFRTGIEPDIEVQALADAADALTSGELPLLPEEGAPVEPARAPKPSITADPELLDIYAKEAAEHLAAMDRFLFECRTEGVRYASEPLVRALHTLKGSSRIAGVAEVAGIADALENYSKALQTVHQPLSNDWIAVLHESRDLVEGVLIHLNDPSVPLPSAGDLQSRAEAFYASVRHLEKQWRPDDTPVAEPGEAEVPASAASDEPAAPKLKDLQESSEGLLPGSDSLQAEEVRIAPGERPEMAEFDDESDLVHLFLEEGSELLDESERCLEVWTAQPDDRTAVRELQRQLHTLKGSARLAGIAAVGDLSHELETVYEAITEGRLSPTPTLLGELQLGHDRLVNMLEQVRNGESAQVDKDVIARLEAVVQGERPTPTGEEPPEADSLAAEGAANEEGEEPELLELFLEEGREILDSSEHILQSWLKTPGENALVQSLQRELHTLKGSARMAGITAIGDLSHALESTFEALLERRTQVVPELLEVIQQAHDRLSNMLEQVWERQPVTTAEELIRRIEELLRAPETPDEPKAILPDPSLQQPDEDAIVPAETAEWLHAETAPDFYRLAMALVEQFGAELNNWQRAPSDPERHEALATAGAGLEQLAREVDVQNMVDLLVVTGVLLANVRDGHVLVSDEFFGLMHLVHERLSVLVEQQHHELPLRSVQDLIDSIKELTARYPGKPGEKDDTEAEESRRSSRIQHEMVRVRRDLMDSLVNYAGEVSIYRSRIEQRLNSFGHNISELDETVDRLRHQLRQFDIETEAQISARYQEAGEEYEDFDPLEFDRFTNMQQLSRAMMESLSDIGSIKGMMSEIERESETLLLQQARVNTELQENLMQTRMVPLVDNAPRLRRIVRQTASELGRKASLGFQGAGVEMDRRVVERLIAPLEHMLRNAVVHGIEPPEERLAAGKDEAGSITVGLSREGAEVVVRVFDDGRGIDADAVRAKAIERGLMEADADLGDQEVVQFILESGFSTAATLSQVAGRGIGMDVVSSEVRQLSGSMEIDSVKGQGTRFTVRLPLSLSVSRALIVHVGEETFAIPLLSVQGIARAEPAEVEALLGQEHPIYSWLGESYELMHPRQAIGIEEAAVPSEAKKQPLILAQSGDHRIALIVDRIEGSREVVVKSLGPQLSTLQSLSGATILADGSIALVLELSALIRTGIAHRHRAMEQRDSDAIPVPSVPTVMIVDDSITVRAVTRRLLKRHGMKAVVAKDGVDALTVLEETIPDVMLLDIEMPRMDGFELATHIRNSETLKGIPIIMITSRTGEKHRRRARDIGVDRYMGKPYSEGDLMENIESLIADAEPGETAG